MTTFFKRWFSRKDKVEKVERQTKVHDVGEYDTTFAIPRAILRLVGLRLTRTDSTVVRLLWSAFYWFEFGNLFLVTWLEVVNICQAARGGTFQDAVQIFSMMPCVGYLFLEGLVCDEVSITRCTMLIPVFLSSSFVKIFGNRYPTMSKSYMIEVHRPVYENLVSELRGMWPQGEVSKAEHEVISSALRQLNYVIQGYYWCNNALLVVFLSPPFVEITKVYLGYDVEYILPFFYWLPYDAFKQYNYAATLIWQTWHGLITIWFMLSGDLLFCIFLSHVTTQFDLLSVRIRRLVYVPVDKQLVDTYPLGEYCKDFANKHKNMVDSFSDKDWHDLQQKELTAIVLRHRALIRLAGNVEDMFSFALLVNFFNSSIIICFCGFCCVIVEKWNELVYKSFLMTALSQTWLLCWYGQRLLESSERVSEALYESGWYKASQSVKSSVLIMLHRSQKNVHVTTYGFSIISLSSYTTIIKTSWSYFTLLLNIYKS